CSGSNLTLSTPTVTANGLTVSAQGWQLETAVASGVFASFASPYTVLYADNGKKLRYFATNGCGTTYSNEVVITVNDKPTISTVSSPTAVCSGSNLTLSTPTVTANGLTVSAQGWQLETAVASGVFASFASPYTVLYADNGKKLRYFATNGCGTTYSNEVVITVNDKPTISTVSSPTAVCSGSNLTLSTPTVTANGLTVSAQGWQLETAVASGVFASFASPYTVLYADNGKKIRYFATNGCGTTYSNEVVITVNDKPTISTVSSPTAVCSGSNLTLSTPTVTANGLTVSAQGWQLETAVASGVFASFASPYTVLYADNGKKLRYFATNGCGTTYSNEVVITVNDKPTISTVSSPTAVCSGSNLTLSTPTVTANGLTVSAQGWQLETAVASGVFASFASPYTVLYADNGKKIRYFATNGCGTTYSNEVVITVNDKPTISTVSSPTAVCSGSNLTLSTPTVTANGLTVSAQGWQLETAVASGVFASFASPYTVLYADNGKKIRYFATNGCGTTYSNEVVITVNDKPTISTVSSPTAVCSGSNLTLSTPTVTANGLTVSAQGWQLETAVASGVFASFASPYTVLYADNGKKIRYFATNGCGTTYSNEVVITVNDKPTISTVSSPTAVCSGSNLTLSTPTVTANGLTASAQGWQLETAVASGGFASFASPYTVLYADNGKKIRYFATNGCGTTYSNEVVITVNDKPTISTVSSPTAVCSGSNLTLSTPTVTANGL